VHHQRGDDLRPIPSDPSIEAKIASITFGLKVVKFEVERRPSTSSRSAAGLIWIRRPAT